MSGSRAKIPPIRVALRNGDLMRALCAYAFSSVSEWALWIGVLVYAHEHGGATAAGTVSLVLVLPATLASPFVGTAADGGRPNRLLVFAYATQALALIGAAAAASGTTSLIAVVALTAVATTAITFIRPTLSVVVPGLVASPTELTAGNLLTGYCDSASILLGPLLASGILAVAGPDVVLWICAALSALSAVATLPLLRSRLDDGQPASGPTRVAMLRHGIREIAGRRELRALLLVLAAQFVLIGGLDLLYLVLAVDEMELSDSVPGLFASAFGVGALVGGIAATAFVARAGLAKWIMMSVGVIVAALVTLAGAPVLAAALILFPLMGISRSVLDLTGRILLQRAAPQESLATTFAVLEGLSLVCSALGVVVVQAFIAISGARAALVGTACLLALLLTTTARSLRDADDSADAPVVAIRLLRRMQLFAALPGPALEGVARAAVPEHVPAGTTIVREGDAGDRYYAIARGEVEVTIEEQSVRTMGAGQGFGEIALLADRPRTATVRALTDVDLMSIERSAFLTVVLGHDASSRAAWGVARAYEPSVEERAR